MVSDNTGSDSVTVDYNLSIGIWHHVALVFSDQNNQASFYVDGQQRGATQAIARRIVDSTEPLYVGANDYSCGQDNTLFDGQLDDVRIWNATRSATDIANSMSTELDAQSGLIAYWQFNNDLTDSSGNGHTLSNTSGATFSTDVPF